MATVEIEMPMRPLLARALPELMDRMRREGGYYVTLPPGEDAARKYTEREHVDPDGRKRDLLAERATYLADLSAELEAIRRWLGETLRAISPPASRSPRLIDVGCGYGRLLSGLDRVDGGGKWDRYGCDPSAHACAAARSHGDVVHGTVGDIPREWGEIGFDVAVLYHVIEHVTDPLVALGQVRELLRPGGRLLVGTPDFDSPMAREYRERFRLLQDPTHISLFSADSLMRCLRAVGFEIERVDFPFPARLDTEEARAAARAAGVSPPARGNVVTVYARRA